MASPSPSGTAVRRALEPPRLVSAVGLLFLLCALGVGSGPVLAQDADGETVDLAFGRAITTVWGNGTRYGDFQVDAFPGSALNLSVEVSISRNRLTTDHAASLEVSFLDERLANVTETQTFEVGPDSPRRLALAPVNLTLPASIPEGEYTMVLVLSVAATDPFPRSNRLEVPVVLGLRDYGSEPYVFQATYLIGAGLLVVLAVGATAYARLAGRPWYQGRRRVWQSRWEAILERWTHDPRRGLYKVVLTVAALVALVAVLASTGFFVLPERDLLLARIVVGVLIGAIYALVALGYTMVYGVLKFINFAHGEILMWGAYAAFFLTVMNDLSFFVGILGAVLFAAALGATMERVAYRPLRGKPRLTPLITAIGVSLFLQGTSQFFFSSDTQVYARALGDTSFAGRTLATWFSHHVVTVFGVPVNGLGVLILLTSIVLMFGLHLFIRFTRLGKAIRAVADDFETASIIGIDVNRVVTTTFVIGSALAGIAGVLYGARTALTPTMGFMPGIKAFTAAVVGGIGNIYGAFVGGFLIGLAENVGGAFLRERAFQHGIAFVILLIVLILRPTGIFKAKESEVRRK